MRSYTKKKSKSGVKSTTSVAKKRTPIVNKAMCTDIYAKIRHLAGYSRDKQNRDLFNRMCSGELSSVKEPSPEDWVLAAAKTWCKVTNHYGN